MDTERLLSLTYLALDALFDAKTPPHVDARPLNGVLYRAADLFVALERGATVPDRFDTRADALTWARTTAESANGLAESFGCTYPDTVFDIRDFAGLAVD